jgi:hypothetical protein
LIGVGVGEPIDRELLPKDVDDPEEVADKERT